MQADFPGRDLPQAFGSIDRCSSPSRVAGPRSGFLGRFFRQVRHGPRQAQWQLRELPVRPRRTSSHLNPPPFFQRQKKGSLSLLQADSAGARRYSGCPQGGCGIACNGSRSPWTPVFARNRAIPAPSACQGEPRRKRCPHRPSGSLLSRPNYIEPHSGHKILTFNALSRIHAHSHLHI